MFKISSIRREPSPVKICFLRLIACLPAALALNLPALTNYVNLNSSNPVAPYASWATAATNIQDAISVANPFDTVLVTNGIYQYGGYSFSGSNRVFVSTSLIVQSVNGPTVTIIKGYQVPGTTNGATAMRCAYLQNGATLSGFTLTDGATSPAFQNGGSVYCAAPSCVVTNCVITGNAAQTSGGGAAYGTLVNCIVTSNSAPTGSAALGSIANNCLLTGNTNGSAAYACTLNNCTVVGNFSTESAAIVCTLNNSIIYYNSNGIDADCDNCNLSNCCTTVGLGNSSLPNNSFSNAPDFVDLAHGNYRLQIGSPCIDAGANFYATAGVDLAGNPRIVDGTVDIGAYENQNTNAVLYVSLTSTNPVPPYANWSTAATNIQDAVNAASAGDVVVANSGTYSTGSTVVYSPEANRVALTNGVTLLTGC
jgi:hypothetical protein